MLLLLSFLPRLGAGLCALCAAGFVVTMILVRRRRRCGRCRSGNVRHARYCGQCGHHLR